jgi:hypothetical protein
MRATRPAHTILLGLITLQYLTKSAEYDARLRVLFQTPVTSPRHPVSQTPSIHVPPLT